MRFLRSLVHVGLLIITVVGTAAITGAAGARALAQTAPRTADIKTPDGLVLKASYFSAGKPGPGVVLFHQCSPGATRHHWDSLSADLVRAGMHVATFDNRSFGETGGDMPPPPPPPPPGPRGAAGPELPAGMQMAGGSPFPRSDGEAVLTYLKQQKDVDARRIAVGGSSCGAADAGDIAMRHSEIKAVVLLSGLPSPPAVTYMAATPSLPVFGIYSTQDMGASSMRAAMAVSKNPRSALKMFPGTGHGVDLFKTQRTLQAELVAWLQAQLK